MLILVSIDSAGSYQYGLITHLLSSPNNKMEPDFLNLADNTGDGFSYELLLAFSFKDIPLIRNPVVIKGNTNYH